MQTACRLRATTAPMAPTRPVSRVFAPVVVAAASDNRKAATQARHKRLRKKLSGTTERPRMAVYKSNEHIYVQVIDDSKGHTLAAASSVSKDLKEALGGSGANVTSAEAVGKKIAEVCKEKNIEKVCFDRGGFKYHGRIKAVADAARAGGLVF
ncbi:hypothetical protein HYH03_005307 [Edaphochlamys debaryana]|uniref:Large ribosomal subunit protein uL18c n=1 Tax=Edaphochlamys debaryana TaxID=47281 RepID=A0A836C125_9CHLO|nr:hypothetical protein HYH03_005307 [Edaphochlamys debaryana]|eukprot:KAG2496481.1 hypothetical protein HYH03_005307 [Edaphochlamys debaryana]